MFFFLFFSIFAYSWLGENKLWGNIPYLTGLKELESLKSFIEECCDNNNFKLPTKYNSWGIEICPIDSKLEISAFGRFVEEWDTNKGNKHAIRVLFNLSINLANKGRAIRPAIVSPLLQLLKDTKLGMILEALYGLLLLVWNSEARQKTPRLWQWLLIQYKMGSCHWLLIQLQMGSCQCQW